MWYSDFFHGLPQRTWKAAQTDEQTQLELELLVDALEFGPGDRLLDVFCGYGRHALPLARMGAEVLGVDISEESIAELKLEARRKKLPLTIIDGDFMALPTERLGGAASFRAVYCLGNSFSFFPHQTMQAFVQRLADLLQPGGRLLVQSGMVAESILPAFETRTWMAVGEDIQVLLENTYDPLTAQLTQFLTYYQHAENGVETARRTAHYTLYTVAELGRFMQQAGLTVLALYGTMDGEPYQIGDEGIWIVAERTS